MYQAKPSIVSILSEQLKMKKLKPAYLFYGEEEFLKAYYLKQLTATFSGGEGADAITLEASSFTLDAFVDAVENMSLSSAGNIVIVRNLELSKQFSTQQKNEFLALLSNLDSNSLVILYYDAMFLMDASYDIVNRRRDMLKSLSKYCFACEFKEQSERELLKWLAKGFAAKKLKIGEKAAQHLIDVAGSDMSNLKSEIEKLSLAADGEITEALIDRITALSRKTDVFGLARDVLSGRTQDALHKINDCRQLGEEPVGVLSIISTAFTEAMLIKSAADSGIRSVDAAIAMFGLNEKKRRFFADYMDASFDSKYLAQSLEILLKTDQKLKESAADKWTLLEEMCVKVALCRR